MKIENTDFGPINGNKTQETAVEINKICRYFSLPKYFPYLILRGALHKAQRNFLV